MLSFRSLGISIAGSQLNYVAVDSSVAGITIVEASKYMIGDPQDPSALASFQLAMSGLIGTINPDVVSLRSNQKAGKFAAKESAIKAEGLLLATVKTKAVFQSAKALEKSPDPPGDLRKYLHDAYRAAMVALPK